MAKPDNNQMNFQGNVTTLANTGTAGGTMYYINLGGIKMLWGTSGAVSLTATQGTSYSVVMPTGFFSTITMAVAQLSHGDGFGRGAFYNDTPPVTSGAALNTATFFLVNYAGSTTSSGEFFSYFIIGT